MVKSTYNFVPAPKEKEVYKPKWANQVSHDIPFSDGESGEIAIKITAETPIFIRNGHANDTEENEFSYAIINGQKKYFIPGTSLKGMIRNVLEMMSLGRLKTKDDVFSLRDLDSADFRREVSGNQKLKTGWLQKRGENWVIVECEHGRVAINKIEQHFSKNGKQVKFKDCTAAEKYRQIPQDELQQNFSFIKDLTAGNYKRGELFGLSPNGNRAGTLVFFGSIDNKKYEYFFGNGFGADVPVPDWLMEQFETVDKKLDNTQWQYFESINANQIPVLFETSENAEGAVEVRHFGFSRLYKLTNTYKLSELEPLKSYSHPIHGNQLDLADTIFGTVKSNAANKNKSSEIKALKGRVLFGHAQQTTEKKGGKVFDTISASPKASYSHFYLKDGTNYLDGDAELRGFKKYPVHQSHKANIQHKNIQQKRDVERTNFNEDIIAKMQPLPSETIFEGKIRFHNLRKVEIGALLSALTLHNNAKTLRHSIGGGKPFGFGKIKLEIINLNIQKNKEEQYKGTSANILSYLSDFETLMNQHCKKSWMNSEQMQELLAMASPSTNDHLLVYPEIEAGHDGKTNEFKLYEHGKTDRRNPRNNIAAKPLELYSKQIRLPKLNNVIGEQAVIAAKKQAEEVATKRQARILAEQKAYENAIQENTQNALETFLSDYPVSDKRAAIKAQIEKVKTECANKKTANKAVPTFKDFQFKTIEKEMKSFRKLKLSDEAKEVLKVAIKKSFKIGTSNTDNSKFHKNGIPLLVNKFPWKKIRTWLEMKPEELKTFYEEVINQ